MTNGEKILNAFPNATTRIYNNKGFTYIVVEQDDKWIADFDMEWWNSEYKEPKKGHWIDLGDGEYKCPKCNREFIHGLDIQTFSKHFPSCPNCGAKMESEVEE